MKTQAKLFPKFLVELFELAPQNFRITLLDDSCVKKNIINLKIIVQSISTTSFVLKNYLSENHLILDIFKSLGSVESLEFLKILEKNNVINKSRITNIQEGLFKSLYEEKIEKGNWDYLILLASFNSVSTITFEYVEKLLDSIILDNETDIWGDRIIELLQLLDKYRNGSELSNFDFLNGFIEHRTLDREEIMVLLDFIDNFNVNDESLLNEVKSIVDSFIKEDLEDFKNNTDLSKYIKPYWSDEYQDVDVDSTGLDSEIEEYIQQSVSDFNENALTQIGFNSSYLTGLVKTDDLINYFMSSIEDDPDYHYVGSGKYTDENPAYDNIDSIFERS